MKELSSHPKLYSFMTGR